MLLDGSGRCAVQAVGYRDVEAVQVECEELALLNFQGLTPNIRVVGSEVVVVGVEGQLYVGADAGLDTNVDPIIDEGPAPGVRRPECRNFQSTTSSRDRRGNWYHLLE